MADERISWSQFANTKVGDVRPPDLLPEGHYVALITGNAKPDEVGKNKTLRVSFPLRLQEPLEDVDAEQFAAVGFNEKGYTLNFWITPNSAYILTDFGKAMGANDEMSVPEMCEHIATVSEPIVVKVSHEPNEQNPDRPRMQIGNAMPLALFQERQARQG